MSTIRGLWCRLRGHPWVYGCPICGDWKDEAAAFDAKLDMDFQGFVALIATDGLIGKQTQRQMLLNVFSEAYTALREREKDTHHQGRAP